MTNDLDQRVLFEGSCVDSGSPLERGQSMDAVASLKCEVRDGEGDGQKYLGCVTIPTHSSGLKELLRPRVSVKECDD